MVLAKFNIGWAASNKEPRGFHIKPKKDDVVPSKDNVGLRKDELVLSKDRVKRTAIA